MILRAVLLLVASGPAFAIVTLGPSVQSFGLTGIGPNASGQGQSKMTWGTCAFDGTNTACTLSGPFTGFGNGGTYSFVVSYAGSGPFPLNAITNPGSDLFFAQATRSYSFTVTLAQANGPSVSFYSFANFNFTYGGNATCTGLTPANCSVRQVGQTPEATITGPITGSFDPAPAITPNQVISAGSFGAFPAIAPATWVEIYGANLATTRSQIWSGADFTGNMAPSALGGTTVTVAGKRAYINFVSPAQVNIQVPSDVPTGSQPLVVTTAGGSSAAYSITVNATQPGLLAPPAFRINGSQHVVALLSNTLTYVLPATIAGISTARAKPGDTLTLYGIGFGPVTPSIPAGQIAEQTNALQSALQITFAGVPATPTYAGLSPGFVGLYQINVVVPPVAASDTVPVAFRLAGAAGSQNLVIAVRD